MIKKAWKQTVVGITTAALLLAGCSNLKGTEGVQPSGNSDKPVTITLHNWYLMKKDNWDVVIAEFEKSHPNIKVKFVSAEDNNSLEFLKRLDLAVAGGDDLDVIINSLPSNFVPRAAQGMFEPLDEYLKKDGVNVSEEYNADPKYMGKYYGLPGKYVTYLVAMNENHLKEAGLPIPKDWTWDEYMEYAKKMTKTDGAKKRYGAYFHSWIYFSYAAQDNQKQNSGLMKDDLKTANVMNPLVRKSLELRLQGEKEGSVTPYSEVLSQKLAYRPQYFNQDASMILTGSFLAQESGGTDQTPANFKTVFAPYPKVNKDDPMYTKAFSDILSVYSKSKHKQEAYTFIRWYTTEGIVKQKTYIPAWKKANMEQVVDALRASSKNPEMIDKESLLNVLKNSIPQDLNIPVTYQAEVEKIWQEEFDKLMLQGQNIDTTMKNGQEKIQKLIDSKK
ncbi:ABC transporter substrate-binding protein [Paenibacillus sp. FSL H8-0034]|uniref:ABC transporter substrate-binding protein n=1 Tax=Paenibacillus sp. FSL H8-0034 TaxID=2954671 RepID=UPI0030F9E35C